MYKFVSKRFIVRSIIFLILVTSLLIYYLISNQGVQPSAAVLEYCNHTHAKLPPACPIKEIYQCGDNYILRNHCPGTGDIIVDQEGELILWCNYTAFDSAGVDCGEYLVDNEKNDCTLTKNLCQD